jgi:hypothetical protein
MPIQHSLVVAKGAKHNRTRTGVKNDMVPDDSELNNFKAYRFICLPRKEPTLIRNALFGDKCPFNVIIAKANSLATLAQVARPLTVVNARGDEMALALTVSLALPHTARNLPNSSALLFALSTRRSSSTSLLATITSCSNPTPATKEIAHQIPNEELSYSGPPAIQGTDNIHFCWTGFKGRQTKSSLFLWQLGGIQKAVPTIESHIR